MTERDCLIFAPENPREQHGTTADGHICDVECWPAEIHEPSVDEIDDAKVGAQSIEKISERAEGLGGEFTYCTLGEPVDIEKLLSGERLPAFDALGAWLFYTATGGALPQVPKKAPPWYLGEAVNHHVWLVYRPELAFLKSPDAALTLTLAKCLHEWSAARQDGKKQLVFAPAKYMSNKQLLDYGIDYAPLPFALYREG